VGQWRGETVNQGIHFLLLILTVIPGQALAAVRLQSADTVDFIRFDGGVYLSSVYLARDGESASGRPLDAADLGPIVGWVGTGAVDADDALTYPNEPCHWDVPDGTAPALTVGDEIHAVRGYATTFRLAARRGSDIVLYQVWCSVEAKVGADLFDIYGRVQQIRVTGDLSEASGFAVIDDRATLDALVGMLLAGKVTPEEESSAAPVSYQLIVELDDGTTFRASTAPGEFLWGLGVVQVSPAFDETLARAWQGKVASDQG
jgi:hypothetical protein